MGLTDLSSAEMLRLSQAWLIDGHEARELLQTMPTATACLPRLVDATRELSRASLLQRGDPSDRLSALNTEAAELDALHDRKARGLHLILRGLSALADDPDAARRLRDLNRLIFPIGLTVVDLPYDAEASAAVRVAGLLQPSDRALLRTLTLPGGQDLERTLDEWIDVARRLGEVASLCSGGVEGAPEALRRARDQWVRVAKTLMSAVRLDAAKPDAWSVIFQDLERAEVLAMGRR